MAILNVSSYITSAGLQAVTSAGQIGPYFAVKYFVPFYDPRIDASISQGNGTNTSALNISALNLTSATSSNLQGEKIYASMAKDYSLLDSKFFYYQAGMNTISNGGSGGLQTKQEKACKVNALSGKPLSQCLSATSFTSSATIGAFNLTNVINLSGTSLSQYNPLSAQPYPTSAFYRVQSYSPKSIGGTSACGSYKCRIPAGNGTFKFNGLALYVSKVDQYNYDTSNSNPILFAVVLFDQPQEKSNLVGGMNSYEFDIDLGFDWSTVGTTGNTPVYVETGYWTKVPTSSNTSAYALNYDGDVVISSSASPGSWMPQSKLTITDPSKPQLRLSYNNNDSFGDRFTDFRTKRVNYGGIISSTGSTDIAVLSIDTSCPTDSLLELGTNVRAQSPKSVGIGINVSAVNFYNPNNGYQYELGNGHNYVFGNGSVSIGEFNESIGLQTSAVGAYNIAKGFRALAAQVDSYGKVYTVGFIGTGNVTQHYNLSFGESTSALYSRNYTDDYQGGSDYYKIDKDDSSYIFNVAMGKRTIANGGFSLAIGESVSALGYHITSIGKDNYNLGNFNTTIGAELSTSATQFSFLIGSNNTTNSNYTFIGGNGNKTIGSNINQFNFVYGFGLSANAKTNGHSVTFGAKNINDADYSLVHGYNNTLKSSESIFSFGVMLGENNTSNSYCTFTHGSGNKNNGKFSTIFGTGNIISCGNGNLCVGTNNTVNSGDNSFIIGYGSNVFDNSTSIGISNSATNYSTSIGSHNQSTNLNTFTFGTYAKASYLNSMAIGYNVETTKENQIVIGGQDISNVTIKADIITLDGDIEQDAKWKIFIEQEFNGIAESTSIPITYTIRLSKIYKSGGESKTIKFTISDYDSLDTFSIDLAYSIILDGFTTITAGSFKTIFVLLDTTNFKLKIIGVDSLTYENLDTNYVTIFKASNPKTNNDTKYYNFSTNLISYSYSAVNKNIMYSGNSYIFDSNSDFTSTQPTNCLYKMYSWRQNGHTDNNRTPGLYTKFNYPSHFSKTNLIQEYGPSGLSGNTLYRTNIMINDIDII